MLICKQRCVPNNLKSKLWTKAFFFIFLVKTRTEDRQVFWDVIHKKKTEVHYLKGCSFTNYLISSFLERFVSFGTNYTENSNFLEKTTLSKCPKIKSLLTYAALIWNYLICNQFNPIFSIICTKLGNYMACKCNLSITGKTKSVLTPSSGQLLYCI